MHAKVGWFGFIGTFNTDLVTSRHYRTNIYITTHTFNGPFSGTTQVSRYQKGKTTLDITEATDSEWQWHQLGHMLAVASAGPYASLYLAPDR